MTFSNYHMTFINCLVSFQKKMLIFAGKEYNVYIYYNDYGTNTTS